MAIPRWQPGRNYQPQAVVQDVNSGALASLVIANSGFESGDQDWVKDSAWTIQNTAGLQGNWRARFIPDGTAQTIVSTDRAAIDAGISTITVEAFFLTGGVAIVQVGIRWYDAGLTLIRTDLAETALTGAATAYRRSSVTATAPENAAFVAAMMQGNGAAGADIFADIVTWNHARLAPVSDVIFKSVGATPGFSGANEPVWPTVIGDQVTDNEITWEAVQANRVVWTCSSVLQSGSSEPTFPTEVGGVVIDNNIAWETFSRRILDENCPNTKQVAILASKIFSGDDDIVGFSATVNPLDWTTPDDAGFIPFGLNTYGSQPVSALGIYRSNLVVFNSKAFQMWQVDEDPANFAILDAVPVGSPFYKSSSPVSNDLVFLTAEGIRSMGIAGASTNLQAGFFGKQIDPLVKAAITGMGDIDDIISLFFPGAGQYWLIFGAEAFVLTMNGGKADMSWSRYVFPSAIDDWTINDTDLFLRSGDKVWHFDSTVLIDDSGGANVTFPGNIFWPYLDFGALGVTKSMIGFDVVADGTFTVSIGYNQKDDTQFTTPYSIVGDTLTGDIIPMPVSAPSFQFKLVFAGNETWEWSASALHLQDFRSTS